MKILIRLVIAVVLLIIVAVAAAFYFVDAIAKRAIESGGTYALGVSTTLGSADVGILSGDFSMKGLNVANPAEFKTSHFLNLGEGGVAVDFGTLRQETVTLPKFTLRSVDVNLEKSGGKSNYNVILDNVRRLQSGSAPSSSEGGKRFIVKDLLIEDVRIHADLLPIGGEATRLNFEIPEIKLSNVGSDTDRGLLLSELSGVIVQAVLQAVVEKGGPLLPPEMLGDLNGSLQQLKSLGDLGINLAADPAKALGDIASKAGDMESVKEKLDDAAKDVEKGIGDAVKGIGDLIPTKK